MNCRWWCLFLIVALMPAAFAEVVVNPGFEPPHKHKEPVIAAFRQGSSNYLIAAWIDFPPNNAPTVIQVSRKIDQGAWSTPTPLNTLDDFYKTKNAGDPFLAVNPLVPEVYLVNAAGADLAPGSPSQEIRFWTLSIDPGTGDLHVNGRTDAVCNLNDVDKPSVAVSPSGDVYIAHLLGSGVFHVHRRHISTDGVEHWTKTIANFAEVPGLRSRGFIHSPIVTVGTVSGAETVTVVAEDYTDYTNQTGNTLLAWTQPASFFDQDHGSESNQFEAIPVTLPVGKLLVKTGETTIGDSGFKAPSMLMAQFNANAGPSVGIVWHEREPSTPASTEVRFVQFDLRNKTFGPIQSVPAVAAADQRNPGSQFHPSIAVSSAGDTMITYYDSPTSTAPIQYTVKACLLGSNPRSNILVSDDAFNNGTYSGVIGEYQGLAYSQGHWYSAFIGVENGQADIYVQEVQPPSDPSPSCANPGHFLVPCVNSSLVIHDGAKLLFPFLIDGYRNPADYTYKYFRAVGPNAEVLSTESNFNKVITSALDLQFYAEQRFDHSCDTRSIHIGYDPKSCTGSCIAQPRCKTRAVPHSAISINPGDPYQLHAPDGDDYVPGATSWKWHRRTASEPDYVFSSLKDPIDYPVVETSYWVEVDNGIWRESFDTDVVHMNPDCDLIETQPMDLDIMSGQTAHFTVSVHSTVTDATYAWYEGAPGNTSQLVGSSAELIRPSLDRTTYYWCRVKSASQACKQDSRAVVARVCQPPLLVSPATPAVVVANDNGPQTAEVLATGTSISYEWWTVLYANGTATEGAHTFGGPSFTFAGPSHDGDSIEVHVMLHGACGDPRHALVETVTLGSCDPLDLFTGFPAEIQLMPDTNFALNVILNNPGTMHYIWSMNDQKLTEGEGTSIPEITIGYASPARTISLEAWRVCGTRRSPSLKRSAFVYNLGDCPVPPLSVDQTAITPASANQTFTASSAWPSVRFDWYRGDSGNTRHPAGTGRTFTPPGSTGTWWVRAVSPCGSHADSPTLTVSSASCSPVRILTPPQSAIVQAGADHLLSVDAVAETGSLQYTWYQDSNATCTECGYDRLARVHPLKTTTYWVQASNGCHTTDSTYATLHVMSCDAIHVSQQPQVASIFKGDPAHLSILATSDFTLSYQWYEGESGDTTKPLAGKTQLDLSIAPLATTSYWVRVSIAGGCEIDSQSATVWVCGQPTVAQSSYDATSYMPFTRHYLNAVASGERLTYQWYEGLVGDTRVPVMNQQRLISVKPAQTTRYWFRATSDCYGSTPDAYQDSGQFTISVCPYITAQPTTLYPEVMPHGHATLSLAADRGDVIDWYMGEVGQGPRVGSGSPLVTPEITAETKFWANVTSGKCTVGSDTVTVHLCSQPTIFWRPGYYKTQVAANEEQLLAIGGSVSGVYPQTHTWYIGESGHPETSTVIQAGQNLVQLSVHPGATTKYWVRLSEESGCYADTPTLTVSVCVPTITVQPQPVFLDRVTNPSATAALSVDATGENLTYQWYVGDSGIMTNPIAGATSRTLANLTPAADTKYWVRVSGNCGVSKDSQAATVTVCRAPAIPSQPVSLVSTANTNVTLSVAATGTELTYQWYAGTSGNTASPLAGKTAATCPVAPAETSSYWVKVSGRCGPSVNSATVQVSIPPVITTQPASGPIMPGTTRTLSVVATGPQLRYQWYSGTTAISGATAASYTTPAITAESHYSVRVWSGEAYVDSSEAVLTVCTQPTIGWNAAKTQVAYAESQVISINGTASGPGIAVYSWYSGDSGNVAASTLLTSGYNLVQWSAPGTVTTKYWVRASEPTGCYADTATLEVKVCIPTITAQPQPVTIDPNSSTTLGVTATGGPLTYQWYTGAAGNTSSPLLGQTSSTVPVAPTVDTTYWVRVSGSCGVAKDSQAATVTVCKPPQISSQMASFTASSGQSVTLNVAATGTSLTYQWYQGTSGNTSTALGSVGTSLPVTAWQTTDYWVKVGGRCGSVNGSTIKVSVPPSIDTQPVGGEVTKGSIRTLTVAASGAQLAYQWYLGTSAITGATATSYTAGPINVDSTYFVRVTSGNAPVDSAQATFTVCQPRGALVTSNPSLSGSPVTMQVDGTAANESYEWYRGESGVTSALVGGGSQITVYPTETTRYWLRTKRSSCDADGAAFTVTVCTPKITTQPQGATINSGATRTLTVAATGTAPLTYQWYIGDSGVTSNPISGATGPSYTTPALSATTKYWVQVTSGCPAAANSATATVTVCNVPAITSGPSPDTQRIPNTWGWMLMTATGTNITYYQWYTGQTGDTTVPVQGCAGPSANNCYMYLAASKYYWVRITGACGTLDSPAVIHPVSPTIFQNPESIGAPSGSTPTLSVAAGGTYLTYQWYRGYTGNTSSPVTGATSATFTTPPVTGPASYWCRVTSAGNATAIADTSAADITLCSGFGVYGESASLGNNRWRVAVATDDPWNVRYLWYIGTPGNAGQSTFQVEGTSYVDVTATTTQTWWCRVVTNDNSCFTDSGGITIPR